MSFLFDPKEAHGQGDVFLRLFIERFAPEWTGAFRYDQAKPAWTAERIDASLRAYFAAGRPNGAPRLASFEGWSDTVRSALIWLGKADPVASMELARAEDPERGELRDMLTAWRDAIGVESEHRLTLADVIEMAAKTVAGFNSNDPEYPELFAAVQAAAYAVTGKRGQQADAKVLGLWLQRRKGRVIEGMRFANQANPKGASTWWIENVSKQQTQPPSGAEGPSSGGKKPRF